MDISKIYYARVGRVTMSNICQRNQWHLFELVHEVPLLGIIATHFCSYAPFVFVDACWKRNNWLQTMLRYDVDRKLMFVVRATNELNVDAGAAFATCKQQGCCLRKKVAFATKLIARRVHNSLNVSGLYSMICINCCLDVNPCFHHHAIIFHSSLT